MKIILHGSLAKQFGREHTIIAETAADAIEGLSRQLVGWPRDLPVDVIDFPTDLSLRSPTEVVDIHLVPAMLGGGGKFGSIILGAVLVVAGILALPGPWGIPLILSGSSMILGGVMGLFMKAPSVNKSNDPPPSKYLGINRNTTAIGTPRALAWGRVRLSGHWLSLQSDASKLVNGTFPA